MGTLFPVLNVLGRLLAFFSLTYLLPITSAFIYRDDTLADFIGAMLMSLLGGVLLWVGTRRHYRELRPRDGFLLVTLSWTLMAAIATLPLLLVYDNMSFTDAFFETVSGLTTTGATVMTDLDHAPPSINLWRHQLNWMGGMGIIVLAVAILPLLGVGGMQLYKAETPGPLKDTKLTARIADTAKALWYVYAGITVACIVCLHMAGLNWLDSICHAFAAMGLGGFSTRDASVGAFNKPAVEFVLIVFMLLAAMNFSTHFLAWRGKSLRAYWYDKECLTLLVVIIGSCFGVAFYLHWNGVYGNYWTALRHVSFNLVSLATDCGFASVDYDKWPAFAPLWMLFLSCISASSGSTGGGIKMIRTIILAKQAHRELVKLVHPAVVNPLRVGNSVVPNEIAFSVLGFIFLYFVTVVGMTFLLVMSGLDFTSSFSAVIACINNAGPGLNVVGPASNFASLTDFQTWVCTITMLLGRLEIFSMVVLFTPQFWRK
ncbi:MAG: TrkH family potassium uptake protein [Rhodocyclaceae bacterium]|nr:TrkH family potassium uptake protein [Rhodocyclaceae bacterium]